MPLISRTNSFNQRVFGIADDMTAALAIDRTRLAFSLSNAWYAGSFQQFSELFYDRIFDAADYLINSALSE